MHVWFIVYRFCKILLLCSCSNVRGWKSTYLRMASLHHSTYHLCIYLDWTIFWSKSRTKILSAGKCQHSLSPLARWRRHWAALPADGLSRCSRGAFLLPTDTRHQLQHTVLLWHRVLYNKYPRAAPNNILEKMYLEALCQTQITL